MAASLPESSSETPMREVIARSIYRQRPFRTAMSGKIMDGFLTETRVFDWEEAPEFYRGECLEIADGVMADLMLAQHAERAR